MDQRQKTNVETLLNKAAKADISNEALHFSQAALNAANALCALASAARFDGKAGAKRNLSTGL